MVTNVKKCYQMVNNVNKKLASNLVVLSLAQLSPSLSLLHIILVICGCVIIVICYCVIICIVILLVYHCCDGMCCFVIFVICYCVITVVMFLVAIGQ